MPTFYDSQNNAFQLGERIGNGGEGTVYACEDFNLVAKIYHEAISAEKTEKLRWMAANKNEQLIKVAAWVTDILHDAPDGKVVGFVMPNVKAKEIHELYSLKSRRVYFPEATWHFLVHTAANVARAFYSLHQNAHIMGDVNHGNCVVLADGTVKLIDCDSYSISTGDYRYRCEVGVATHLAPELQGADLSEIERENKHDNFGLAVIIFQLLFLGRHPFAGNYLGDEDKSIEECIRELRFAYGEGAEHRKVEQPPGTLPLAAVSPRVALMFERAFLTEDRPEPREWIEALEDLLENLKVCDLHPGHLYFNQLKACPWCEIEAQTGLMLFPFITSGKHLDGEKPFNIFTVENLIASLDVKTNLPARPPKFLEILPPPSSEAVEAKRENRRKALIIIPVHFFGLIFLSAFLGGVAGFFLGTVIMFIMVSILINTGNSFHEYLKETLADAPVKWANLEKKWTRQVVPQNFDNDLTQIRQKLRSHQQLQQQSVRQLKDLSEDVLQREIFTYLRSHPINEAEKLVITKRQRQILIGKGVKTAAEVVKNRLSDLQGINEESATELLEWRGKLENDFKQNAETTKIVQTEETRFINEISRERRRIEMDIERLLTIVRAGSVHIRKQQQQHLAKSEELSKNILQARSDDEFLGNKNPAVIALLVITFLAPFIGGMFSSANEVKMPTDVSVDGTTYGISAAPSPMPAPMKKADLETPDENITDAEIAALTWELRARYAENLYIQSADATYKTPNYKKAEQKIRIAIRLMNNDTRFLNQLGYVLYMQTKYTESLSYLNRSLEIKEDNSSTKIFIGINYLKMKRFEDAKKTLREAISDYPDSFEGHYNIGLAYIGLKDYDSAAELLRRAIELNPDDADSHYELGYCYYKLGFSNKAKNEYLILLKKDAALAEELRKKAKLETIVPNFAVN